MHIIAIANKHSDGLVGVVHSTVCDHSKFKGTRTYFEKLACALHSSNSMWRWRKGSTSVACHSNESMDVALCKPVNNQILGIHETRVWLPCCMHYKVRLQKGVAHEERKSALLYLHILILCRMWSNLGQTRIIFNLGLTRMTWTKCDLADPVDPTWFQRWCE